MARARNIKPGFFQNELLAEVDPLGRLLFAGLWTLADREGRLEDRAKRIKVAVLPYDDCDTEYLLSQLETQGFIHRYQVGEGRFIEIPNFAKHQNPHCKEPASAIPAPCKPSASTVQEQGKHGTSTEVAGLIPDSLNLIPSTLIPDSLNPDTGFPSKDLSPPSASTKKSGTTLPDDWVLPKAWGEWALAEKAGITADDVRRMAENFKDYWIANSNRAMGKKADWLATWRVWVRNQKTSSLVQYKTASERRMAVTDASIAEWLASDGHGQVIEGECHAG